MKTLLTRKDQAAICAILDVHPNIVTRIVVGLSQAEVTVLRKDADGHPAIDPDTKDAIYDVIVIPCGEARRTGQTQTCAHCGRLCGDRAGGYATVGDVQVCHPNVACRPDCYRQITVGGHPVSGCERGCHVNGGHN